MILPLLLILIISMITFIINYPTEVDLIKKSYLDMLWFTGVVWNFPIDVKFKSTNVFGWPRIAISVRSQSLLIVLLLYCINLYLIIVYNQRTMFTLQVYGLDFLGRDVVYGYGSALLPLSSGQHVIDVDMYTPMASSMLNQVIIPTYLCNIFVTCIFLYM